jgi:hypothetical protein
LAYFKLLDLDINIDIFYNTSETIKRDYTEIFIRFIKKLKELKLDYNIVIFIHQADCAYNRNDMHNFLFLLRQCIPHLPPYLKFILTFTTESVIDLDEISRLMLLTEKDQNELFLTSESLFLNYSQAAFEILNISNKITIDEFLVKCNDDFERILDTGEMLVYMKVDFKSVVETYELDVSKYLADIKSRLEYGKVGCDLVEFMGQLKMPISMRMLAKFTKIEESKLTRLIKNDLAEFVWSFNKRPKIIDAEEENKADDSFLDGPLYA